MTETRRNLELSEDHLFGQQIDSIYGSFKFKVILFSSEIFHRPYYIKILCYSLSRVDLVTHLGKVLLVTLFFQRALIESTSIKVKQYVVNNFCEVLWTKFLKK